MRTAKSLVRLGGYPGWVCHAAAQFNVTDLHVTAVPILAKICKSSLKYINTGVSGADHKNKNSPELIEVVFYAEH